jgi:hypothetical protein
MIKQVLPPRHDIFLVAENVRQETGGKTTIIGLYSFGEVVLPKGTAFPTTLPMAWLFAFKDGEGIFDASVEFSDSTGTKVNLPLGKATKVAQAGLNLIINFSAFQITAPGRLSIEIKLNGKVYQDSMLVSVAPDNSA